MPATPGATALEATDAGGPLLQVQQVVMQFGGLRALDRVDLAVMPGTIHGLIGPNGSGKSTMMNVLTGIYVPTVRRNPPGRRKPSPAARRRRSRAPASPAPSRTCSCSAS